MDRRSELGEFLRSRRARRQPEELGLTSFGRRRVPGLRREELARAAALSVDYYVRLEQGRLRNPSAEVVDAVANALGLEPAERRDLHNLARPKAEVTPGSWPGMPSTIQVLLDAMQVPAGIYSRRGDVLAWNALAAALLVDFGALRPEERNMARLVFLHPEVAARLADPEAKARDLVAQLRMESSRTPDDESLATLIGELTMKSPEFARLWASHRVREKTSGMHRYRHPVVGEFSLRYEAFQPPEAPDVMLVCQVAEPGTPDEEALRLLASWTADAPDRVNAQLR